MASLEGEEAMKGFVAVKSWMDVVISPSLKREALLFDQVAIVQLETAISSSNLRSTNYAAELEWLRDRGLVVEASSKGLFDYMFRHDPNFLAQGMAEVRELGTQLAKINCWKRRFLT